MAEDKRPPSPAASEFQRLAQLLSQAEHGLKRELTVVLEEEGYTVEQWRILVLLLDGRSHSMSEIAELALFRAPTLTRVIDRMVADNLAYRKADPQDRRRVLIHITPRGRLVHQRLAERVGRLEERMLAEADTDEVPRLAVLLTRLVDRLR